MLVCFAFENYQTIYVWICNVKTMYLMWTIPVVIYWCMVTFMLWFMYIHCDDIQFKSREPSYVSAVWFRGVTVNYNTYFIILTISTTRISYSHDNFYYLNLVRLRRVMSQGELGSILYTRHSRPQIWSIDSI